MRPPRPASFALLLTLASAAPPSFAHPHPESPDTSRVPPPTAARRALHAGKALAGDLRLLVTSPARMRRSDALWTAGVVVATGVTLANDQAIQDALVRSRGHRAYDAMRDFGGRIEPAGQMVNTLPYWVGGAAVAAVLKVEPVEALCLDVLESHLVSGAIRNSAKLVVGRERPGDGDPYRFGRLGTSFPSGHTSVAFEIATLVTRRTRRTPLLVRLPVAAAAYGVAGCLAVERVDSMDHWPSDVLVGAVSGAWIAATVAARNEERRDAEAPLLDFRLVPSGATFTWRF